jgi:hypothetical protein
MKDKCEGPAGEVMKDGKTRALCDLSPLVSVCSPFGVTAKKSCAVRKGTPASAAMIDAAQGVVQAAGSVITQYPEPLPTSPRAPACPSFTPNSEQTFTPHNSQNNSRSPHTTDRSNQANVMLDTLNHRVHMTREHLLRKTQGVALGRVEWHVRRQ